MAIFTVGSWLSSAVPIYPIQFKFQSVLRIFCVVPRTKSTDDEVDELAAVLVALLAEDGTEDGNDDVVDPVSGGLNNGVGEQQHDSDILEAVAGEQERNSAGFDDVSEGGLDLVVEAAVIGDGLSLLDQSDELSLGLEVVLVLRGGWVYLLQKLQLLLKLGLDFLHAVDGTLVIADNGSQGSQGISRGRNDGNNEQQGDE